MALPTPFFRAPRRVRSALRRVTWCLAGLLALLAVPTAVAHGPARDRLAALNARIAAAPGNADLLLARAALHREAQNWTAALADLDRADAAGRSAGAALERARVHVARGAPEEALATLAFLGERPAHAPGAVWHLRARALRDLGRLDEADAALARAAMTAGHPGPELFLERAAVALARHPGDMRPVIAVLDGAIRSIGPVPSLTEAAVELELARGDVDAALARLDRLPATGARDFRLARRGDLLSRAGRASEARAAYRAALAALEALPPTRRAAPARGELAAHLHAALAASSAGPPAEAPLPPPRRQETP